MSTSQAPPGAAKRLAWIDIAKGISILLIIFFHFFGAYDNGRYPWPFGLSSFAGFIADHAAHSAWGSFGCIVEGCFAILFQRGPNAVGVFLVLSGFGLTYSLTKSGDPEEPKSGWMEWYKKRVLRLFPMYWVAHAIYLVSPFIDRKDPLDYHFLLSMLGDRIVPVSTMFFYLNPSWWFFGLLLELYLVFPLLLRLLKKLGSTRFLILCALFTIISRYIFFGILEASGNWVQGAFFGARLFEFAAGMVLAVVYRRHPSRVEEGLSSWKVLLGGIVVYTLGSYSYQPGFTYVFTDGLLGTGFFVIIGFCARLLSKVPLVGSTLSLAGVYSYGLYLLHHPYMIYAGERLNGGTMTNFIIFGAAIVSLIALFAIPLEFWVNRAAGQLLDRRQPVSPAPSPPLP